MSAGATAKATKGPDPETPQHFARYFLDGAAASCVAEALSLPLEVAKMRLQLQRVDLYGGQAPRYTGMLNAFSTITRQEGILSLWKGLEAGLHKQVLYTGLRIGLYDHLLGEPEETIPIHYKIFYAAFTTGLGILVANPSDVVQTKFIAHRTRPIGAQTKPLHAHDVLATRMPSNPAQCSATSACSASPIGLQADRAIAVHTPAKPGLAVPIGVPGTRRGFSVCSRGTHFTSVPLSCSRIVPHGASSEKNLLWHIYGNHRRWLSNRATAYALQPFTGSPWQAGICWRSSSAPQPPFMWQMRVFMRQFSSQTEQSASCSASKGWACKAGEVAGPKTTTGVPLQNARMAYYIIVREEGFIRGLYRGFWPNFGCSCMQGASEIATYDVAKTAALAAGFSDSMPVHLAAGMTAGFVATIVSNPLDVVSTRLMAAKKSELAVGKSTMETISQMWEREGLASFYKGFGPNVLRISTFNMALWTSYEQIRRLGNE